MDGFSFLLILVLLYESFRGEPRERSRGSQRDGSKERGAASDAEKQQSGGESDSSSTSVTKSTSRWFRRARADHKARTSSDSGMVVFVKGQSGTGALAWILF